jgi:hypothetical protein
VSTTRKLFFLVPETPPNQPAIAPSKSDEAEDRACGYRGGRRLRRFDRLLLGGCYVVAVGLLVLLDLGAGLLDRDTLGFGNSIGGTRAGFVGLGLVSGHKGLHGGHGSALKGLRFVASRRSNLLFDPGERVRGVGKRWGGRLSRRGGGLTNTADDAGEAVERAAEERSDGGRQQIEYDQCRDGPGRQAVVSAGRIAGAAGKAACHVASEERRDDSGDDEPDAAAHGKRACVRVVRRRWVENGRADPDTEQIEEELGGKRYRNAREDRTPAKFPKF